MSLLTQTRTLALAVMTAASIFGGAVVGAHAQDNSPFPDGSHTTRASCEGAGFLWVDGKGCADNYCLDGLFGYGDPGETQALGGQIWMCDGFSGRWIQVAIVVHPTGPLGAVGARPIGGVSIGSPAPSGPRAPVGVSGATVK